MGSISDAVLFGSFRRLRVWALALAVALVGTWLLDVLALVDLSASSYRQEGWLFAGALPGGILFGFGMVQAGGCVSRNLVRLGSGSLKALVTLLVLATAAIATAALLPSPVTLNSPPRNGPPTAGGGRRAAPVLPPAPGLPALARGPRHRPAARRRDPAGLAGHLPGRGPAGFGQLSRLPPTRARAAAGGRHGAGCPGHGTLARRVPGRTVHGHGRPAPASRGRAADGRGRRLGHGLHPRPGSHRRLDPEPRLAPGAGRHAAGRLVGREVSRDRPAAAAAASASACAVGE